LNIAVFYSIAISHLKQCYSDFTMFNLFTHHCDAQPQVAYCFNQAILHFAKVITDTDSSLWSIFTFITLSTRIALSSHHGKKRS